MLFRSAGNSGEQKVDVTGTSAGDTFIGSFTATGNPNGLIKAADSAEDKAAEAVGKIQNTRGTELPSTGGMGTTILYIGGSILVILAAVLLITKRRMNAED